MTRFVALLRGVNVGGVTIRMAELAEILRDLGYGEVKTVLASGNAVFTAEPEASEVAHRIEAALAERYGRATRVLVIGTERLREVVAAYPFEERDGWHRYAVFLLDPVLEPATDAAIDAVIRTSERATSSGTAEERIARGDGVLYWTVERGRTLDSPFGKSLGAAGLRGATTNRNLNTLEKLLR